MSSDEEERRLKKQIFKNPVEVQKARLERLMNNVEKPVFIPEKKEVKPPRAFQPHEFVRNVMGASAGAGSGEFDIYRGCRRRQIIREAYLNRVAKEQEANEQWLAKVENSKTKAENQTAKRRKKRLKRKGNPKNKKTTNGQKAKSDESGSSSSSSADSDDEAEKVPDAETKVAEALAAPAEEQPPAKEPSPPPPPEMKPQQHEKTDVRKHLRNRQHSSDEEENA